MDQKPNRADQYNEARALSKARRFNEAVELSESCLMDPTLPRLYCVRFALLIAWLTHDWKKARYHYETARHGLHVMRLLTSRGTNDDTQKVLEILERSLKGIEESLADEPIETDYDYIDEEDDDDTKEEVRDGKAEEEGHKAEQQGDVMDVDDQAQDIDEYLRERRKRLEREKEKLEIQILQEQVWNLEVSKKNMIQNRNLPSTPPKSYELSTRLQALDQGFGSPLKRQGDDGITPKGKREKTVHFPEEPSPAAADSPSVQRTLRRTPGFMRATAASTVRSSDQRSISGPLGSRFTSRVSPYPGTRVEEGSPRTPRSSSFVIRTPETAYRRQIRK